MNKFEGGFEKKEKKEEEGLSTGWKAVGAITLGLLLEGKLLKLAPLGGGLDDKEMAEMEAKGGWFKSVAKKSAEAYTGFEKLGEMADEHDFKEKCKKREESIAGTESAEDKQKLEEEYNQMVQNRNKRLDEERSRKETRGKMFEIVRGIAGF